MNSTTIAVDLAKNVFEIAVSRHPGKVAERHRVSRSGFLPFFAKHQPATILLEACGTAHYWARELERLNHHPVLVSPQHVRPYVQGNKTDRSDAKGLLETSRNEDIRPVPVKSEGQQNVGALHRLRSQWMATRTSRLNLLRGLLREVGLFIPVGARFVVPQVREWLADASSDIPGVLRKHLAGVCDEIRELEKRIHGTEQQLKAVARQTPLVERLMSIPGIGLLSSTALFAFVGDFQRFPSGRHLASFLGLTPKEYSSGQRRRLGRISKRGDTYLRMLLIHGARSVLRTAQQQDRLRSWACQVRAQRGYNKATVAIANKLARIVWAVACKNVPYQARKIEKD